MARSTERSSDSLVPARTLLLLGHFPLFKHVSQLRPFLFLRAMALHGLAHGCHFLLGYRKLHELYVIFRADLVADEDADIQGAGLHVVALSVDEETHAFHDHLQEGRVQLH